MKEIQFHSTFTIDRCYASFLIDCFILEEREYTDDLDQIREVLIHGNYLSQKDIEICASLDILDEFGTHVNFSSIRALHHSLRETYVETQ